MIALIDYGAGNLTSVRKAFAAVGADLFVPGTPRDVAAATAIVVPGVGHFGATRALAGQWTDAILARVGEGRPLLGICLGMQWLFEGSDEAPGCPGLGLLAGRCYRLGVSDVRLKPDATQGGAPDGTPDAIVRIKVPHVGWNAVDVRRESSITDGLAPHAQMYFTHSFAAPVGVNTVAVTEHGEAFAAIAERGHVTGLQFHPEKSGEAGLRVLRNFLELAR